MQTVRILTTGLLAALLAACATPGGDRPEFGESVRHMIQAQTYEPGDEVPSLRGENAAAAMDAYRTDRGDRERVGRGMMRVH